LLFAKYTLISSSQFVRKSLVPPQFFNLKTLESKENLFYSQLDYILPSLKVKNKQVILF